MAKETTDWKAKNSIHNLYSTEPHQAPSDNRLVKAGLIAAAGVIIAALARGVRKSSYYDSTGEDEATDKVEEDLE